MQTSELCQKGTLQDCNDLCIIIQIFDKSTNFEIRLVLYIEFNHFCIMTGFFIPGAVTLQDLTVTYFQ